VSVTVTSDLGVFVCQILGFISFNLPRTIKSEEM